MALLHGIWPGPAADCLAAESGGDVGWRMAMLSCPGSLWCLFIAGLGRGVPFGDPCAYRVESVRGGEGRYGGREIIRGLRVCGRVCEGV